MMTNNLCLYTPNDGGGIVCSQCLTIITPKSKMSAFQKAGINGEHDELTAGYCKKCIQSSHEIPSNKK